MSELDDLLDTIDADQMLYNGRTSACRQELADFRNPWQPIESAGNPKVTGIRYLVFLEGQGISFAYYWGLGEWQGCGFQPTHWMTKPELP